MNLVEHYIRRIISATDISDRYEEEMKKYYPNYELKEPMYEVKLEYDCYGHIGECTEWWKKSYYIEVLEKGYFLA